MAGVKSSCPFRALRCHLSPKFPDQIRPVGRRVLWHPLVWENYWVGVSGCAPEITNGFEDHSCSRSFSAGHRSDA